MIQNTTKLIISLMAVMTPALAMTDQEAKMVGERTTQIIRENHLNRGKGIKVIITEEQGEAMLAAIQAGDKEAQVRIAREIVAQPTTRITEE